MSITGDIERCLRSCPAIIIRCKDRIWATQLPDTLELPHLKIEVADQKTQRTSGDSISRLSFKITAYSVSSEECEFMTEAAADWLNEDRHKLVITDPKVKKVLLTKVMNQVILPEQFRTPSGQLGYNVPLTLLVVVETTR